MLVCLLVFVFVVDVVVMVVVVVVVLAVVVVLDVVVVLVVVVVVVVVVVAAVVVVVGSWSWLQSSVLSSSCNLPVSLVLAFLEFALDGDGSACTWPLLMYPTDPYCTIYSKARHSQ